MNRHRRTRSLTALAALSAALAVSAIAPSLASGQNVVDDLLNDLGLGGQSGGATPAAGVPGEQSDYQPPLHGDNPHGQGTVGTVDIQPSDTLPLSGDPAGGEGADQEEIVAGRARGEQNADGTYHGHITILALFGNEVLGVDSGPGETETGPLEPLQENLLDAICTGSGDQLCLEVLAADSQTTGDGSANSFAVLRARIGPADGPAVEGDAASSNGSIQSDGSCQTSHGDSSVANVGVGGSPSDQESAPLQAEAAQSSSESQACNNGTSSVSQDSEVIQINNDDVPIPCESGTPDTEFTPLSPLLAAVCNADDTNGVGEAATQAGAPYGVREALTAFALILEDTALVKATTAASESHAVAPPGGPTTTTPPTTPPTTPGGAGGQAGQKGGGGAGGEGGGGGGEGAGAGGPVAEAAGPGTGDLAFTGTDVLILGLIGMGLVAAGLATTRMAVRHRRATV
jgi:hypothetical protein